MWFVYSILPLNPDISILVPDLTLSSVCLAVPMQVLHGLQHEMHTHTHTHASSKPHSHWQMNPTRTALVTRWVYTHASRRAHTLSRAHCTARWKSRLPSLSLCSQPLPCLKPKVKKKGGGDKKEPSPTEKKFPCLWGIITATEPSHGSGHRTAKGQKK